MSEKGPSAWGLSWVSEAVEEYHITEHADEMGLSEEEYLAAARKFANSKDHRIKSFKAKNGSTYIYNPRTNEFMIVSPYGKIVTYYHPTNGEKYYNWQITKDLLSML